MNAPIPSERGRRVAWCLCAGGIVAYLMLSAQGLLALGIPYDAPWGPFTAKLHPGTWLICAAFLVLLASHGHPLRVFATQVAAQPLLATCLACMTYLFGYSIVRYGPSGAAFIIDTLMMPPVCAMTLLMLEARRRHACLVMIVVLLTINGVLGIGESLAHARLIPLRIIGEPEAVEEIFRPSALLGHPLANALITSTLMPLVLHLRIATPWRCALFALLWIALLSFGGRTSFVLASVGYGGYFAVVLFVGLLRGRFSYLQITGTAFALMLAVGLLGTAIAASGVGERIIRSMVWDDSASVRERIWGVVGFMSDDNLLVGGSPAEVTSLIHRLNLGTPTETIENFWLLMFLQFGFIGSVPFALGIAAAVAWLWKSSRGALRLSALLFFVAASSNNSLASKSVSFSMLFVGVAVCRNAARERPRARTAATAALPRASTASAWPLAGAFVPMSTSR